MNESLVVMEHIEKSFPGVKALSDVQLELRPHEVIGLVGENGAGKSTLMKVLTGIYSKDSGSIKIRGVEQSIQNPKAAQMLGISIIHQELNLMPHLSAAQNIFIGRESMGKRKFIISDNEINKKTQELFDLLNIDISPTVKIGTLTVAKQQMVEIAKAISYNADILIMDEPSAALTDTEIQDLFKVIRQLKERGAGIIYISHRLEELKQITDRVTVMRDGRYIDTVITDSVSLDEIIKMMVGREVFVETKQSGETGEVVLQVKNLNRGKTVQNVSFELRRGEILGMAGLIGAGRTETARAIFGADKADSGEIKIFGETVAINSPNDAVRAGIGYLSEDRKSFGLAMLQDVDVNLTLANMKEFQLAGFFLNQKKSERTSKEYVEKLNIKTPSIKQKVLNLSGGNQQKVVVGKWLLRNCDILIFDEPTRGIDVGAKGEIYKLLNNLALQGKSIIMISSELPEIMRMSHRVVVMCEGRVTGIADGEGISQENIMRLATKRG